MSRLTRIVCDNPDCKSQVEKYATDWYADHYGALDTPPGWYMLAYRTVDAGDPGVLVQPFYFCSTACVRAFTGEHKEPQNR